MRRAKVFVEKKLAGYLYELKYNFEYKFEYLDSYSGQSVSLTMPVYNKIYNFMGFPPFFDGLLPEGLHLEALLKNSKLDRNDLFSQLMVVGNDLVGNVTVVEESSDG